MYLLYPISVSDATTPDSQVPRVVPFPSAIVPFGKCQGQRLSALSNPDLLWFTTIPLKSRTFAAAVSAELEGRGLTTSTAAAPSTPAPQPPPPTPTTRGAWRDQPPTDRQRAVLEDRGLWREGLTKGEASDMLDQLFGKVTR